MVVTDLDVNGVLHQHSPLEAQLQATLNIVPANAWYAMGAFVLRIERAANENAQYSTVESPHRGFVTPKRHKMPEALGDKVRCTDAFDNDPFLAVLREFELHRTKSGFVFRRR
jgi:hypothetical protein